MRPNGTSWAIASLIGGLSQEVSWWVVALGGSFPPWVAWACGLYRLNTACSRDEREIYPAFAIREREKDLKSDGGGLRWMEIHPQCSIAPIRFCPHTSR
jgi:hypothetical protein